jgi:hypothetical protein
MATKLESFLQHVDTLGGWSKKKVINGAKDLSFVTKEVVKGTAHVTNEVGYSLWHWGYANFLMGMETSHNPVYYDLTFWEERAAAKLDKLNKPGRPGQTTVSLPFMFQGEKIRATRHSNVLSDFGPREQYPQLLMTFDDPIEHLTGDESLRIEAHGPARDLVKGDAVWRLYMPGRQEISVAGGGRPITKPQAEMTAADVVEMLANRIKSSSNGKINVTDKDLMSGLALITKRSQTMRERWNILEERLKFNQNLVDNHHYVAMVLRSMIQDPNREFAGFLEDLDKGQIGGWGDFLNRIDQMKGIIVGRGTGVLPRLMYQGMQILPDAKTAPHQMEEVPSSLLINLPGLRYFNSQVQNYKQNIIPMVDEVSATVSRSQRNAVKLVQVLARGQEKGWAKAVQTAAHDIPKLEGRYGEQAALVVEEMVKEAPYKIRGINAPTNTNSKP